MAVSPTGLLSTPIHLARVTVASSATFQSWVGAATRPHALPYILPDSTESDDLPIAVVGFDENFSRKMIAGGARHFFQSEGDLFLLFRDAITEDDDVDAFYSFCNTVGAVVAEMEEFAGGAGYLAITNITLAEPPARAHEDEAAGVGDFYEAIFTIEYGP